MTDAPELARVELRHVVLHPGAPLRTVAGRSFLQLDNPPPVRTVMRLSSPEGSRAVRVEHVVEVETETTGKARGCFVTRVDEGTLRVHDEVGSEALKPGHGEASAPVAVSDGASIAAEVVETTGAQTADAVTAAPEPEAGEGSAETDAEDDDGDEPATGGNPSGGKRRKGRRRR